MRHVQQRARGIPLNPHVPRFGEPRQGPEGAGAGNLGLVLLMCCQVGDAPDGIALDFDVGGEHLSD